MLRDDFSYWLRAEPAPGTPSDATRTVSSYLNDIGLTGPGGPLAAAIDGQTVTAEADPRFGTIEEDPSIRELVDRAAKAFPGFVFALDENDETDKSVQFHSVRKDGKLVLRRSSRLILADEPCDRPTAAALLDFLFADRLNGDAKSVILDSFMEYLERKEADSDD